MANLFDSMRDAVVDLVSHVMGYIAVWAPVNGDPEQTAEVLFKDDTEGYQLDGNNYDPAASRIEYRVPVFDGLKASVDAGVREQVTVQHPEGAVTYYVQHVDTVFDGRTMVAYLLKVEE